MKLIVRVELKPTVSGTSGAQCHYHVNVSVDYHSSQLHLTSTGLLVYIDIDMTLQNKILFLQPSKQSVIGRRRQVRVHRVREVLNTQG